MFRGSPPPPPPSLHYPHHPLYYLSIKQKSYREIVLVVYCCVTSYHKISSLQQHTVVISQSLWVRSPGLA